MMIGRPKQSIAHDSATLIVGESPSISRIRDLVERVARTPVSVLITGPSGAGKEMVARAIHRLSGRRQMAAVNMCAIPDTMIEATLFGHVRGAFTGAHADGAGYFAEADGGTLFLDEIGSISMSVQAKLLRAIETHEYRPVGGKGDRRSDFRLVSATNDDVRALVARGAFRGDLAHRLGSFIIAVPPLCDRPEDIPALVTHFLVEDQRWSGMTRHVDSAALNTLMKYPWPGNVRELRHVLQSAVVLGEGTRVTARDVTAALALTAVTEVSCESHEERQSLLSLLDACAWDTARVADRAGVHRVTIYRRMERLGITPRRPVGRRASDAEVARPRAESGDCVNSRV
jgi:DNA-binding NtrC family response regulator